MLPDWVQDTAVWPHSPCSWSQNLQIYFGDMELSHLFTPSLIARTHPRHFDGAHWWAPHQGAHSILWSPFLTRIASCPCNATDIQRCIVMPGCPSAHIPFKALPPGWHQPGCCSKRCPLSLAIKWELCTGVCKALLTSFTLASQKTKQNSLPTTLQG